MLVIRSLSRSLLAVFLVLIANSAYSAAPPNPTVTTPPKNPKTSHTNSKSEVGSHGGKVVTEKGRKFEIKMDHKVSQLDVYTSNETNLDKPENLNVLLYKDPNSSKTVRLQPMGITPEGNLHYQGSYQGSISPAEAPFVSFGIQFDLSSNAPNTQPSSPSPAE